MVSRFCFVLLWIYAYRFAYISSSHSEDRIGIKRTTVSESLVELILAIHPHSPRTLEAYQGDKMEFRFLQFYVQAFYTLN